MSDYLVVLQQISAQLAQINQKLDRNDEKLNEVVHTAADRVLKLSQSDSTIGTDELAQLFNCPGPSAARRRIERDPEMKALALTGGGGQERWRFRKADVIALLNRRAAEKRKKRPPR